MEENKVLCEIMVRCAQLRLNIQKRFLLGYATQQRPEQWPGACKAKRGGSGDGGMDGYLGQMKSCVFGGGGGGGVVKVQCI